MSASQSQHTCCAGFSLHNILPAQKLICAFFLAICFSTLTHIPSALLACFFTGTLLAVSGIPPATIAKRLLVINIFFMLLWLFLPLGLASRVAQPLVLLGPLAIDPYGIHMALLITLKGNAMAGALFALAGSSDMVANGHALHTLRVPQKFVALLLITFNNIGRMSEEYKRLFEAARLRGFTPKTSIASYTTYASLLGLLLIRAWQHAQRVEEAMRLRSFSGRFPLLPVHQRNNTRQGVLFLAFSLCAAAIILTVDHTPLTFFS